MLLSLGFKTVHSGPLVRSSILCRRNRSRRPIVREVVSVSQEEASSSNLHALVAAQKLLDDGKLEECLAAVKAHWLKNPDDSQAVILMARLMNDALGAAIWLANSNAFPMHFPPRRSATTSSDLTSDMFETGHGLIDVRQHELAAMLLEHCAKIHPNEPVINYELGFSFNVARQVSSSNQVF